MALSIDNYKGWCDLTIDGQKFAGSPPTEGFSTVCVAAGSVTASVTAAAATGDTFEIGADPWESTNATQTTSTNGTSTATITATAPSTCVFVCCPFSGETADGGPSTAHDAGSGCNVTSPDCP